VSQRDNCESGVKVVMLRNRKMFQSSKTEDKRSVDWREIKFVILNYRYGKITKLLYSKFSEDEWRGYADLRGRVSSIMDDITLELEIYSKETKERNRI